MGAFRPVISLPPERPFDSTNHDDAGVPVASSRRLADPRRVATHAIECVDIVGSMAAMPRANRATSTAHTPHGEEIHARAMYRTHRAGFLMGNARRAVHLDHGRLWRRRDQGGASRRRSVPFSAGLDFMEPGKKGVVLDLGTTEGRAHAIESIGAADVLVESFRPGDMADWGLSYDTLSQRYPRLIYCSITGFGQKGPARPSQRVRRGRCGQGRPHAQFAGAAEP